MSVKDNQTVKYNKEDIIREVSNILDKPRNQIRNIYECVIDTIINKLAQAENGKDISIKPYAGVELKSFFKKETERVNYLSANKETVVVPDSIKVKVKFSKTFSRKLIDN